MGGFEVRDCAADFSLVPKKFRTKCKATNQADNIGSDFDVGQLRNCGVELVDSKILFAQSKTQAFQVSASQILWTSADDIESGNFVSIGRDKLGELVKIILRSFTFPKTDFMCCQKIFVLGDDKRPARINF